MRGDGPASRHLALLYRLRWLVPLILSLLGLGYILAETLIGHEQKPPHPLFQVLTGVILLSLIGPAITYLGLNWALEISSRLETAERTLREQNRQLAIIAEVSRVANSSLDADQTLSETLSSLLELVDVESGAIWLRNTDMLELRAARGVSDQFLEEERVQALDNCMCGQVVTGESPLTLEDLKCGRDYLAARCGCEQFESAIGVPVRTGDEIVGVLEVATSRPRQFGAAERDMLVTIGFQIGTAIEKAQLHRQLQRLNEDLELIVDARTAELVAAKEELAQKAETLKELLARVHTVEEETRARIAGDLHDGVQQLLNGALFEAQAVRQALQIKPEAAGRQLDQLQDVLQRIETEMRHAVYSLRPVTLDTLGLVGALNECVHAFEHISGTPCQLSVQGTPRRIDNDAELAAFRIVQEALNNVEAHAHASQSTVLVQFEEDRLRLEISDDGQGFNMPDCNNGQDSRLGLIGMQERAESVGGWLQTRSAKDAGTQIILTLPLVDEET